MSDRRRTIFVPFIWGFGGVERLVLGLSQYLTQNAIKHAVVTFDDRIDFASHASWPMRVLQLGAPRSISKEISMLRRTHLQDGPLNPILAFDLKGAFYAQFIDAPYVVHLTDPPSLLPTDITRWALSNGAQSSGALRHPLRSVRAEAAHRVTRRGVRRAEKVVCMTHRISEELQDRYDIDPIVVRPGVSLPAIVDELPPPPVRMLSVSRLEKSKRLDWVLRALAELERAPQKLSDRIDWRLDVIGEGPELAQLEAYSKELGLGKRSKFHGWVSEAERNRMMRGSSLFVMPATQGYGLPALESLAYGRPAIVHRDSGVSEILGGSPWVRIVESSEGKDLAAAINDLCETISSGRFSDYSVPTIPSEPEWAEKITQLCGWI